MQVEFQQVVNQYKSNVDLEIKSFIYENDFPMYDMMKYHLGWINEKGQRVEVDSGKMIRSTLCLLACEAVGSHHSFALPAAGAVELLHNYSLIHDDIQDGDVERRHRPTVWKVWGAPQAINAGTAMRIMANKMLYGILDKKISTDKYLSMQNLLDETSLKLLEGQYLDIDFEKRFDIDVDDYLNMIMGKTAALIACSLQLGCLAGCDDKLLSDKFKSLGINLGLAFQIRDDYLGVWGDQQKTGKPSRSDILNKKKSLPIVHALQTGHQYRFEIIDVYSKNVIHDSDVEVIIQILRKTKTKKFIHKILEKCILKAEKILFEMDIDTIAKGKIQSIVKFLMHRNY